MYQKTFVCRLAVGLLLFGSMTSISAAPVSSLKEAVTKAVTNAPAVKINWYSLQAAIEEQRIAVGGYYPSIDLEAEAGRQKNNSPNSESGAYHPDSSRITLTQMLFDGFSTKNEVARLGFEKLAAYYDLKQTSEEIAQETMQAYYDVLRYQKLLDLAKENYLQHRLIYNDIEERVTSGLGRRVDLEQASGRLALSESNLLTERTNLHDVMIRFHRLVGEMPAPVLEEPLIPEALIPEAKLSAVEIGMQHNSAINAAIERIRAARAELRRKKSAMMPELDLRLRQHLDHNTSDVDGRFDEQAVELVLRYNLYNGGSDSASKRMSHELLSRAFEQRELACRDARQLISIAHNDISAQKEQVVYQQRNQESIGNAREAYRKQFDIGQRTLLDLLDTENEYFEVKRTLVNARTDLDLAKARTLSSMGLLLKAFSISEHGRDQFDLSRGDDASLRASCPVVLPESPAFDKNNLMADLMSDPRFRHLTADTVAFNLDVKFNYNSSVINEDQLNSIRDAADFLNKYPHLSGVVEGHTDSVGTEAYNEALSQRRANSVLRYLTEELGIAASRLKAQGRGETSRIDTTGSDAGRSINRRVELVMVVGPTARKPRLSDFNSIDKLSAPSEGEGLKAHSGWDY
jgi:adhesin transport system outer membrane protein